MDTPVAERIERDYIPPTLIPVFSTNTDQPDGLVEANDIEFQVAGNLTLIRD